MYTWTLFVCLLFLAVASAWPELYDTEFKRWALSRRSSDSCQTAGGKCYSSSGCCDEYVCAVFDEFGMSPVMPGWCVHRKELEPCVNSLDCDSGTKCRALDGHRYCVPMAQKTKFNSVESPTSLGSQKGYSGTNCKDDSDCASRDPDGTRLCCQKVRRGRQGIVKKCDPITKISVCVAPRE